MCGIAGVVGADVGAIPASALATMQEAILFRGRDAQGVTSRDGEAVLFNSRLAVIDVPHGQQPMADASGRFVIVYNGEVYNHLELRASYARAGARFSTHCDTEVVLEGFKLKGPRVCNELNGMFAFAIWDRQDHSLFLARDHLGKKPLFWCSLNGIFAFASTLDAFSGLPGWTAELSQEGLAQYDAFGSFPEAETVYRQARSLRWASWCKVRPGDSDVVETRYWQPDFSTKSKLSLRDAEEEYQQLLADSVKLRLRSDVPLALTFSGGVDSGSIAATTAQELGTKLTCYTIDFHTADDPSEETLQAQQVAAHLDLPWEFIQFDYHNDLLADLDEAYRFYDQPAKQLALVYSHRLYGAIRAHAKVVLSGNGSDEIFTGYEGDERTRGHDLFLAAARPFRGIMRSSAFSPYLRMPVPDAFVRTVADRAGTSTMAPGAAEALVEQARTMRDLAREAGAVTRLDFLMYLALTWGAVDANYRIPDVSGLAQQVEVRSPYLDHRMVEFAARLPHRYKVRNPLSTRSTKYLIKRAYENRVPHDVAWSRKKGMGWNLRWQESIANDPAFHAAFEQSFRTLEAHGLDHARGRHAWVSFIGDIRSGRRFSAHAAQMMGSFMLGRWLARDGAPS